MKLWVVSIGPGGKEYFTEKALKVLNEAEVIVGYTPYIEYVKDAVSLEGKEVIHNGMKKELERCEIAIEKAREGKLTAIVSTGDAGLYGMAGPILEMAEDLPVEVLPGVSANFAAAAMLGAPLMHDNATISLSDLLTPWEVIEKRIRAASTADFVISLYNPRSKGRPHHLKQAIDWIRESREDQTPVGIVRNAGRNDSSVVITTLGSFDFEVVDMLSVVLIGNSNTYVQGDRMITPRGYQIR